MLCATSHGLPQPAATCIGSTLFKAKYYLRTVLNQSKQFWQHSKESPVFGTGQGSSISPSLCCLTYSDAMNIHADVSQGAEYTCPHGERKTTLHNIGFVDDTNTTVAKVPSSTTNTEILRDLTKSVQSWHSLLRILGGSLEAKKTIVYLLSWKFSNDGTPYADNHTDHHITLHTNNTTHHIPISPSSESYRTLGFYLTMTLNNETQYDILFKKCDRISSAICSSSCSPEEATLCYKTVFLPAVKYVLPLTYFTAKECHKMWAKPTQRFLQKACFAASTSRALVFAPTSIGGLGYVHLYTEQGISQINRLLQSLRTPNKSYEITRIAMTWWHVNAGCGYELLEHPDRRCIHSESKWFVSLRQFLTTIRGSFRFSFASFTSPRREHDVHIMDAISRLNYAPKQLRRINYCRLYLQVELLSDIVTSDGNRLISTFWSGSITDRLFHVKHKFPFQQRPDESSWQIWKLAIRKAFCHPYSSNLRQPLGAWTTYQHGRFHVISLDRRYLWNTSASIDRCHPLDRAMTTRHLRYSAITVRGMVPSCTIPVDIVKTTARTIVCRPSNLSVTVQDTSSPATVFDELSSLTGWQLPLLSNVQANETHFDVAHAILKCSETSNPDLDDLSISTSGTQSVESETNSLSKFSPPPLDDCLIEVSSEQIEKEKEEARTKKKPCVMAACDGGSKDSSSSFGWTIMYKKRTLVTNSGSVYPVFSTSYRAECVGLLSILSYLKILCKHFSFLTLNCSVKVRIDNQALLSRVQRHLSRTHYSPTEALVSERDILLEIEHHLDTIPVALDFGHVKSHQDDTTPVDDLLEDAIANIEADRLATEALESANDSGPPPDLSPHSQCLFHLAGHPVTFHLPDRIRLQSFQSGFRKQVAASRSWSHTDDIDWNLLSTLSKRPSSTKRFIFKLQHRLLPTSHILNRRSPHYSPLCPACGEEETNDHFLLCHHESRQRLRIDMVKSMQRQAKSIKTDPLLRDLFIEMLNSVLLAVPFPSENFPTYRDLIESQHGLGVVNFMRGFVSVKWTAIHHDWLASSDLPHAHDKSNIGLLSLIPELWTHLHSLWLFRCEQQHRCDVEDHVSELRRATISQVTSLYEYRELVLPEDRRIFRSSLATHLQDSVALLRAWITNYHSVILASHRRARSRQLTGILPLTHYFTVP